MGKEVEILTEKEFKEYYIKVLKDIYLCELKINNNIENMFNWIYKEIMYILREDKNIFIINNEGIFNLENNLYYFLKKLF